MKTTKGDIFKQFYTNMDLMTNLENRKQTCKTRNKIIFKNSKIKKGEREKFGTKREDVMGEKTKQNKKGQN